MHAFSRLIYTIATILVSGCAKPQSLTQEQIDASWARGKARQENEIAGWIVQCVDKPVKASSDCFLSKHFPKCSGCSTAPFQVKDWIKLNPDGTVKTYRFVSPGWNTYPGREPTIRVDANFPISNMRSDELIRQLRNGKTALAEYHVWPSGPETMSIDLSGFPAALDRLDELTKAKKSELSR